MTITYDRRIRRELDGALVDPVAATDKVQRSDRPAAAHRFSSDVISRWLTARRASALRP